LSTATVPELFKSALITPLLKKPDLDSVALRSYRSNFQFIGGVQVSRAYRFPAALQLPVCGRPSVAPAVCIPDTSLYTEMAVLTMLTDILYAVDYGNMSVLALFDLSAIFDTVDHDILLTRFKVSFGISGAALYGFQSYLTSRVECVRRGLAWSTQKDRAVRRATATGGLSWPPSVQRRRQTDTSIFLV